MKLVRLHDSDGEGEMELYLAKRRLHRLPDTGQPVSDENQFELDSGYIVMLFSVEPRKRDYHMCVVML